MKQMLITLLATASLCTHALEGARTSKDPLFKSLKPKTTVDATTRAKELEARKQAMQADIAMLKKRLATKPSDAKMAELHTRLKKVKADYGWVPETTMVYGIRAIDPMLKGQNTNRKYLLQAFKQLNEDLKARGVDLIILPLAPTPHFQSHLLVDGIEANHDYYPGWTEMMIEMIENDLEVVDTTREFRKEAANEVLVSWANDFHTGSTGRQIAARALAKRLQRYDFARELNGNQKYWTSEMKERTGTLFPQRILVVNRGMMSSTEYWQKTVPGKKRYEYKKMGPIPDDSGLVVVKGKKGTSAVRPEVPKELPNALKTRKFKYMNLKFNGDENALARTELVMIGDSQLHSAVFGSGLPAFINAEVGGVFRWGSKSWSGFSPPEIYLEVVPDSAVQPRVAVLAFLPKYFWHAYDQRTKEINEAACKYKPRPLPPFKGAKTVAVASTASADKLTATVKVTKISKKPTNDPTKLDYDEALMHVAAVVQDGPMKGKEIGLRYWILHDGAWTKADGKVKPGTTLKLGLQSWDKVIEKDGKLSQHQTFNDTEQDFLVPIYWVVDGALSPKSLVK